MNNQLYKPTRLFYAVIAAMGLGTVTNLVLFFLIAFMFAGGNGDKWVRFYFGGGNGAYFMIASIILALCYFPITKKMNIVFKNK